MEKLWKWYEFGIFFTFRGDVDALPACEVIRVHGCVRIH